MPFLWYYGTKVYFEKGGNVLAHLKKFSKSATGHMTEHFERKQNDLGEYIKFGNQDIDTSKTHLNYNLGPERSGQVEFIKNRCSEVKCLNRADVKVMCSWVVTKPKDFDREEEFFKETYKFLENRYGKENVVSAYVHKDEITPHMHFSFVPVVYDKEKELYKVSAKEKIPRSDLKCFHKDLEKHLEKYFGREVGVLNESTKEGNKAIDELKKETAVKKLNNLKEEITVNETSIGTLRNDLNALERDLRVTNKVKGSIDKINQIEVSTPLFQKDKVTMSKSSYESLLKVAKWALINKEKALEPYKKEIQKHKKENESLKKNTVRLENEIEELKDTKEKFSLSKLTEKAKEKSNLHNLENKVKKLERFIEQKDLVSEFKQMSQNRDVSRKR